MTDCRETIERFLAACRRPALLEPGDELLPLARDNFALDVRGSRLVLQAWDRRRNLVRRITGVREEIPGRLELAVEKFGRRPGRVFLLDLARKAGRDAHQRGARLVFREQFRQFLCRQYPDWTVAELSVEADLEHSLSPAYPRALIRKGRTGRAAIALPPENGDASAVLSFGLIWLDYVRRREARMAIEGLAVFLPAGHEQPTTLRIPFLDPLAVRCEVLVYSEDGYAAAIDPRDYGNLDTRVEPCARPQATAVLLRRLPGAERVPRHDGSLSLRVHGIEFARVAGDRIEFGLSERISAQEHHEPEIEALCRELGRLRSADAADRDHPLWRQAPEGWLESQVRAHIQAIDASLRPEPVYGQVPAMAGGNRGVMDLLAVDHAGRLAVLELKATADLHLPLQSLDYWMRVKWHLDRGEFQAGGYFPDIPLSRQTPRLLLVSPALEFHPTTETLLSFFSPDIDVERIGVGVEWRRELEVMFRLRGADTP